MPKVFRTCSFIDSRNRICDLIEVRPENDEVIYLLNGYYRVQGIQSFFTDFKPYYLEDKGNPDNYIGIPPDSPRVKRDMKGETVDGIKVTAYVEDQETSVGVFPTYSGHWSTPGRGAKNVQRLFAESDVIPVIEDLKMALRA